VRKQYRLYGLVVIGLLAGAVLTTLPASAQTAPAATQSDAVQPRPITNQEEWQNAVIRILQRYGGILSRELQPLGLDGVFKPKISFYLSPNGDVSGIELVESSGDALVDAAALKVPASGASFPAFSPDMASDKPKKLIAPFEVHLKKPEPEQAAEEPARPQ